MAYDAATGTVVLFGGYGRSGLMSGTWTWDGLTWTKQAPATRPSASGSMAYDAATGTIVLFGDDGSTWTWDGSTWTRQAPPASPPGRSGASMAYDAAARNVVLFGGRAGSTWVGDTWTWGSSG
jgi:hypothetical protein